MNGVHDMGGMHGFGPVPEDDAAFHADWERTAYALNKLLRLQGVYNIHEYRHSVERMEPGAYLTATYFERWFTGVEQLLLEHDVLEEAEIERRLTATSSEDIGVDPEHPPDELTDLARSDFRTGADPAPEAADASFDAGQTVRVRNAHPAGHTRAPRYARGAVGTVSEVLGLFDVPDARAHGEDDVERVLAVEFDAAELWGDDTDADVLTLDLWERYLTEPR
ncbi:MAG: nitrile hydratase subunit beta [Haloferacaceae archaeon]